MTQACGEETTTLAQLSKKIDEESRFTRVVCALCTLAIVGVLYYTMTSAIAVFPDLVLAKIMGNMQPLAKQYHMAEAAQTRTTSAAPIK